MLSTLTGKEVYRYDGADPANTRFDYGAMTDADCFSQKGLDLKEMIRPEQAVVSDSEMAGRMGVSYEDDYDYADDDYYGED